MRKFLKSLVFVFLFLVAVVLWLLNSHKFDGFDEATNHCRATQFYVEGSGEVIFGVEDLEIDHENDIAFLSKLNVNPVKDGSHADQGSMYVWNLKDNPPNSEKIEVRDISAQVKGDVDFNPHGISMLKGEGWWRLFVVNHAILDLNGSVNPKEQVLILDYVDGQLQLNEMIEASNMCSPNDVASLGPSQFLVTNDHGACDEKGQFWEDMLRKKASYLLYWDGEKMNRVASGFAYANGVSIAPHDPSKVYLAATGEGKVYIFDRELLLSGSLTDEFDRISLPLGPDNMSWSENNDLIIAGFPNVYRFAADSADVLGVETTPAMAMIMKGSSSNYETDVLYNDESGLIRGTTVAGSYGGYTIATSVFDDNILICENVSK